MSTRTYDTDVLEKAMKSLTLSEGGYWPQFITTSEKNPQEIIAHLGHCDLPPECHDLLPFPSPRLHQEAVDGIEAEIVCGMTELPMFVCFPMTTPILCCMLTGVPSKRRLMMIDERRNSLIVGYAKLYEDGELSSVDFLCSELGRRFVMEMQALTMEREAELLRLSKTTSAAWPRFSSSFSVCGYYQMVINILVHMASHTIKERCDHVNTCYNNLRNAIDTLLYDHFGKDVDVAECLRPQLQSYEYDMIVYNKGRLPSNFAKSLHDYTVNVLSYMEQCIMAMLDIPQLLREQLVLSVQRPINEDLEYFATEGILDVQALLMNMRMRVNSSMWSMNSTLLEQSKTEANIYKSPSHLVWLFNQLVRRAQSPENRMRAQAYVQQIQRGEAQLEPLTIEFF